MAVLITGGAGYIGSHTSVELLNSGDEIVIVDNFSNSKPQVLQRIKEITQKNVRFYEIDLLDKQALERVFAENNITDVIHFAGYKAVGESVQKPLSYYHNNLLSTIDLCEVMAKYHVKNLVFSSSATVYGIPKTVPITEDFPLSPMSPYGTSKLMIEHILKDLCVSDAQWRIAILRYFNPIGAHESGLIGEDPTGIPNNLMPFIAQVATGKRKFLSVFGDDYQTPDGTGIRDYIHVVDLSIAHIKAIERLKTQQGIDYYNIGTGKGCSVLSLVKAYENATGITIPYQVSARRAGDIDEYYANPQKALQQLNFKAERGIEQMCEDTHRWQTKNPNGYSDN